MIYADHRGELHSLKHLPFEPKEVLISVSQKNVLRGLHISPYAKYIYVVKGHIYDFFYNTSTNQYTEVHLLAGDELYVPSHSAHGFYCFEDSTITYFLEDTFDATKDKNVFWNSPELRFKRDFPHDNLILSSKDAGSKNYDPISRSSNPGREL